ncbi:hypothetical protein [uncultured Shewanella sp.]|uniref:hypothetical protein n=1 Tax=uncultured Shewanella sp. TaxID=173975 RepID=UPI0026234DE7|nr:hypothetical protein [uncultured Shewanella sp.]
MIKVMNKKKVLSIIISALSINAHADTSTLNKSVLNITSSNSYVTESLQNHYGNLLKSTAENQNDSKDIDTQIEKADIVYADLSGNNSENDTINAYLKEAKKQHKPIVLENMQGKHSTLFPLSFNSPVVVITHEKNGIDQINTFNVKTSDVALTNDSNDDTSEDNTTANKLTTSATDNTTHVSLSGLTDEERTALLSDVTDHLDANFTASSDTSDTSNSTSLLSSSSNLLTSSSESGGELGYSCPSDSSDEQLCYSAMITPVVTSVDDDDTHLKYTLDTGYSFGAYRTSQGTSIFVSPWGSANPDMYYNENKKKGYFLQYVKPTISVSSDTNAGLGLYKRTPENANNTSTLSSTSGMSYTIKTDSKDAYLGGDISYSSSKSVSTDISDWKSVTTTDGYDAEWSFDQSKYSSTSKWLKSSSSGKLHSVPDISRYGLQYSAEGVWFGALDDVSGDFDFTLSLDFEFKEIYSKKKERVPGWSETSYYKAKSKTASDQVAFDTVSFDTDWLKSS